MTEFQILAELSELNGIFEKEKVRQALIPNIFTGLNYVQDGALKTLFSAGGKMRASELVGCVYGKYAPRLKPEIIYTECLNLAREWICRYPLLSAHGYGSPYDDTTPPIWDNHFEITPVGYYMEHIVTDAPPELPQLLVNGYQGGQITNIPGHPLSEVMAAISYVLLDQEQDNLKIALLLGLPDFATGCVISDSAESTHHLNQTKFASILQQPSIDIEVLPTGEISIEIGRFPLGRSPQDLISFLVEQEKTIRGLLHVGNESLETGKVRVLLSNDGSPEDVKLAVLNDFKGENQFKCKMGVRRYDDSLTGMSYIDILKEYALARVAWEKEKWSCGQDEAISKVLEKNTEIRNKFDCGRASIPATFVEAKTVATSQSYVVAITTNGIITRTPTKTYVPQDRGGKGVDLLWRKSGGQRQDNLLLIASGLASQNLIMVSDKGKVYFRQIADIFEGTKDIQGDSISALLNFTEGEHITAMCIADKDCNDTYMFLATSMGFCKLLNMEQFKGAKKAGRAAIKLADGDFVASVCIVNKTQLVAITTQLSQTLVFSLETIADTAPAIKATRVVVLKESEKVVLACPVNEDCPDLFLLTTAGNGKRTPTKDIQCQDIGKQGVQVYKELDTLIVAAGATVKDSDVLIAATSMGKIILFPASDIPSTGKGGIGVIAMKLTSIADRIIGFAVSPTVP